MTSSTTKEGEQSNLSFCLEHYEEKYICKITMNLYAFVISLVMGMTIFCGVFRLC